MGCVLEGILVQSDYDLRSFLRPLPGCVVLRQTCVAKIDARLHVFRLECPAENLGLNRIPAWRGTEMKLEVICTHRAALWVGKRCISFKVTDVFYVIIDGIQTESPVSLDLL